MQGSGEGEGPLASGWPSASMGMRSAELPADLPAAVPSAFAKVAFQRQQQSRLASPGELLLSRDWGRSTGALVLFDLA
ncbi:hypothetical protein ACP4OV_007614 [Aristida adscensionis]